MAEHVLLWAIPTASKVTLRHTIVEHLVRSDWKEANHYQTTETELRYNNDTRSPEHSHNFSLQQPRSFCLDISLQDTKPLMSWCRVSTPLRSSHSYQVLLILSFLATLQSGIKCTEQNYTGQRETVFWWYDSQWCYFQDKPMDKLYICESTRSKVFVSSVGFSAAVVQY